MSDAPGPKVIWVLRVLLGVLLSTIIYGTVVLISPEVAPSETLLSGILELLHLVILLASTVLFFWGMSWVSGPNAFVWFLFSLVVLACYYYTTVSVFLTGLGGHGPPPPLSRVVRESIPSYVGFAVYAAAGFGNWRRHRKARAVSSSSPQTQ